MSILRKSSAVVVSAALLAVALGAWMAFGPARLGGPVAYHRIAGQSMEPRLHAGDLVALRRQSGYAVGDVVAYRNPDLDGIVLHRIVAREGDRYVMQGDANGWADSYRPSEAELGGRFVARVPRVGSALATVQQHRTLLTGVTIAVLVLSFGVGASPRVARASRRSRAAARDRRGVPAAPVGAAGTLRRAWQGLTTLLMLTLAGAGVLAALAFTQPPQRTGTEALAYQQEGAFSYAAVSSRSGVYDGDAALTGQPVFLQAVPAIAVRFDYAFSADALADAGGTIALTAELSDEQGWRRALALQPERPFTGGIASAEGTVTFARLTALIDDVDRATGVRRGYYRLIVRADVRTHAALGAAAVDEQFAPTIAFRLEPLELTLETRTGADGRDPLTPSVAGSTTVATLVPARLALPGLALDVAVARRVALVGALVSALSLAAALAFARNAGRSDPDVIARWHGDRLVPVAVASPAAEGGVMIEVERFADLVRIAEREGALILHANERGGHTYVVAGERVGYRFRAPLSGERAIAPELAGGLPHGNERG